MSVVDQRRWLRPAPRIERLELFDGHLALCIDEALLDPQRLVDWAAQQVFEPAAANAYPGLLGPAPETLMSELNSLFDERIRSALGGRRTISAYARLGLVSLRPAELRPAQWLCHRDPLALDPRDALMAAALLYLFPDPSLGGTRFYRPKVDEATLTNLIADMGRLSPEAFAERHQVEPGYIAGDNRYFEWVAELPAVWNRLVFYDGGLFHSGHLPQPERLSADPRRGRLTLNAFFACRRPAR